MTDLMNQTLSEIMDFWFELLCYHNWKTRTSYTICMKCGKKKGIGGMNLLRDLFSRVFKSKKPNLPPEVQRAKMQAPLPKERLEGNKERLYRRYVKLKRRLSEIPASFRNWGRGTGQSRRPACQYMLADPAFGFFIRARHFGTFSRCKPFAKRRIL